MSTVLKFEDFPNEVLLECFKYLNALHLFHSFDHLNDRFCKLIRSMELRLSFAEVSVSTHEVFRTKTREDPSINAQVISIDLSDKRSFDESNRFLSDYAMKEFPNLKYFRVFIKRLERENATKFLLMLSSMPQLRYFSLNQDYHRWEYISYEEFFPPLVDIPIEQLQRLHIPILPATIENVGNVVWLLEYLAIEKVTFEQILKIVRYSPHLKELQIKSYVCEYIYENIKYPIGRKSCAMNLEKLSIKECDDFQGLEYLFSLTPNLKDLTYIAEEEEKMLDAQRWEQLISFFLKNLIHFRFQISLCRDGRNASSLNLEEFQSDFWAEEKPWKIRYELSSSSILVHSIPYLSNSYRLSHVHKSYHPPSIDPNMIFARVTDLSIGYSMMESSSSYYFSNVECLKLGNDIIPSFERERPLFVFENIQRLNELVPLSKIKELFIDSEYEFESPEVIIQLLNASTNLSTLKIDLQLFRVLSSTNEQFVLSIQEKIRSLIIVPHVVPRINKSVLFDHSYSVDQFCEQYPHLEQITTKVFHPSDLLILLRRLPRLTWIDADIPLTDYSYDPKVVEEWERELIPALMKDFHIREDQIYYDYQSFNVVVCIARTINRF